MKNKDTNHKSTHTADSLQRIGRQWVIALYDFLIYTAVATLLLVIYDGSIRLDDNDVIYQYLLSGVFILVTRLILKVYNQIWRYGGIQCFIRLLIADGIAFLAYYADRKSVV